MNAPLSYRNFLWRLRFLALLSIFAAAGCSVFRPTLVAMKVDAVPASRGMILKTVWADTPSVTVAATRGAGSLRQSIGVQLHAIADGRTLAILAIWPDDVQSIERQSWVWDPAAEVYRLEVKEVDRCGLLWPLTPGADFNLFAPRKASYDLWLWQAAWSDIGGFADDERLDIRPLAAGEPIDSQEGDVFLDSTGVGKIVQSLKMDDGIPGVLTSERPRYHRVNREPGAAAQDAGGSAADIAVQSNYKIDYGDQPESWFSTGGIKTPGEWFGDPSRKNRTGYWSVIFYRQLKTADKQSDYQIDPAGPNAFAVAISDGDPWPAHFTSGPIRLKLPK